MRADDALAQIATVGANSTATASIAGVLTFLSNGPVVSPAVFLTASAIGGVAGGFLSTLKEPGELKLRNLIVIMGHGALLGPAIVALALWLVGLPPTLPAVSIASGLGGTLSWTISKNLSKQIPGLLKAMLSHFSGNSK